jgi:intracellular sulfur oxidation DsrE/DsrF family protein
VVLPSLSEQRVIRDLWRFPGICLLFFCLMSGGAFAEDLSPTSRHYVVDIELQTLPQFQGLLDRADQLLLAGQLPDDGEAAVVFVLHGPVLRSLLRQNYFDNRQTVDLAARLSALGVIELKACRTWMRGASVSEAELQPFVETVSYGPGEVRRLVQESNYVYF